MGLPFSFIAIIDTAKMDRTTEYWKKKQKTKKQNEIEQELGCKFFKIDPDKKGFGIFRTNNEIFKHIKISTKKTLKNKNSTRFLWSEFKSYDTIKAKPMN